MRIQYYTDLSSDGDPSGAFPKNRRYSDPSPALFGLEAGSNDFNRMCIRFPICIITWSATSMTVATAVDRGVRGAINAALFSAVPMA